MSRIAPLYTSQNCHLAFQLNWSLTIFERRSIDLSGESLERLRKATEPDGVRILEHHHSDKRAHQFFVSTRPDVAPSEIVHSVKARWQYLLGNSNPQAFQRNYHITSVGSAELDVIDGYIDRQVEHHPLADPRIQLRAHEWQYHDESVDLGTLRHGRHGKFLHNLHLVFEHANGEYCIDSAIWESRKRMLLRAARKKCLLVKRLGILSNHMHALLGCSMGDTPLEIGLSLLNNLAFVEHMNPVYRFGFFAGTVGPYNQMAIRRRAGL